MDKLTDETINAWLDGEATRQEGERIEAAIPFEHLVPQRVSARIRERGYYVG